MKKEQHCSHEPEELASWGQNRRKFLQLATLGAGVSMLAVATKIPEAHAAGNASTLLLSCMDYRLMDEIERYMLRRGLYHNYDHIVLAGASLGAITDKYPAWRKTFWNHLELAVQMHGIHTVMVLDHRDCGAYKALLGVDYAKDAQKETAEHAAKLTKLKRMIVKKYPKIEVETLLMNLNGEVEVIQDAPVDHKETEEVYS